jgi:hypothetical protein
VEYQWMLLSVLGFLLGMVVGWVQGSTPLKKKVKVLQRVLEMNSAQKMERILQWEQRNRKLTEELKWAKARILALESDLERVNSKLMWKDSH